MNNLEAIQEELDSINSGAGEDYLAINGYTAQNGWSVIGPVNHIWGEIEVVVDGWLTFWDYKSVEISNGAESRIIYLLNDGEEGYWSTFGYLEECKANLAENVGIVIDENSLELSVIEEPEDLFAWIKMNS